MNKRRLPPPKTAATGLFVATVLLLVMLNGLYFYWYKPLEPSQPKDIGKVIVYVLPEDDLNSKIKEAAENTILLIESSQREGNFEIIEKANITLRAEGEVVIWAQKGSAVTIKDSISCRLEGIRFYSLSKKEPTIQISHGEKIVLSENKIEASFQGVFVNAKSQDIRLESNEISSHKGEEENVSPQIGVEIHNGENITIIKNSITLNRDLKGCTAIKIVQSRNISLQSNHKISGYMGIFCSELKQLEQQQNKIFDNKLNTKQDGVHLKNSQGVTLTYNTIESKNGNSLVLYSCNDIRIGNGQKDPKNILRAGRTALSIYGGSNIFTNLNTLLNYHKNEPVLKIESCSDSKITINEISGSRVAGADSKTKARTKGGGILILDSQGLELKNNTIKEGLTGVVVKSSKIEISKNVIEYSLRDGIHVENSNIQIKDNEIRNNSGGIELDESGGVVENNNIHHNRNSGVHLESSSPEIINNKIHHNDDGISIEEGDPVIRGNKFQKNRGDHIKFEIPPTSWEKIKDNEFDGKKNQE